MWWKIRRTWNNVLSLMQLHIPTLTKKGTIAYITKTIAFCLKQGCFIRRLKIHDVGWQRGAKDFLECQNIHFNHMLEGNKGCAILRKQEKTENISLPLRTTYDTIYTVTAELNFASLQWWQSNSLFRLTTKTNQISFVRGIHRWSVASYHKGSVMRRAFPYHDVIMMHVYLCRNIHIMP